MTTLKLDSYVLDTLMCDLVGHDRRPSAFLVYLYLWRHSHGNDTPTTQVSLLDVADRATLRAVVGARAEEQVYRYGGCDRGRTWRALHETQMIRSRFTGHVEAPTRADLRAFVDLSIVNELDVVEQDAEIASKYGDYFRSIFATWADLASPAVIADARRVLDF